jgi:hypothetical protein
MEPISFGLALAGIPGIFMACIDCYERVQFGREFEDTFEMTWCKLEAAQLRLARWGTSIGIQGPDSKLSIDAYSEEEVKVAYRWLNEIKKAFDSAIETSGKYGKTAKPNRLQLLDTDQQLQQLGGPLHSVHSRMRKLIDTRVKPRKRDQISWALYRKGAFETLIETISDLTDNLVNLFPSTVEVQEQLCREEVKDLDADSLALLNKAINGTDDMLQAILQLEAHQRPNFYGNIDVRDQFKGHFGDNVAPKESSRSNVFSNIRAGGNATAHFGNNIGTSREI